MRTDKSIVTHILSSLPPILLLLMVGCGEPADRSFDFTQEHLFTPGIEGPAVDSEGNLFAVNYESEGTIGKVDLQGNATVYATLTDGSVGNGIRFDADDNMYIADYVNHNVLLIPAGENRAMIYAHEASLNQPNDLAIAPDGTLYASDPNWEEGTGQIWRIDREGFHLLESNMGTTNGIEVSPGGEYLYVNESVQRRIWRYELDENGLPQNKKLFFEFEDFGLDGMRCDNRGNLYVCRYDAGKVIVLNPQGEIIRQVALKGEKPSNIAFGGKDRKQCFVTLADRGCFESFYADFPGRDY